MIQYLIQTRWFVVVYVPERREHPYFKRPDLFPPDYWPQGDVMPFKPWWQCLSTLRICRRLA